MEYTVYAFNGYGGYRWMGAFTSRKAFLDASENRGECREYVREHMDRTDDKKEITLAMKERGRIIKSN